MRILISISKDSCYRTPQSVDPSIFVVTAPKRHRYDDIIMGFYGKAFYNGLQAKAAGSKPILFPANQNLGRSGLYHS